MWMLPRSAYWVSGVPPVVMSPGQELPSKSCSGRRSRTGAPSSTTLAPPHLPKVDIVRLLDGASGHPRNPVPRGLTARLKAGDHAGWRPVIEGSYDPHRGRPDSRIPTNVRGTRPN